jgi:hypothetical protein
MYIFQKEIDPQISFQLDHLHNNKPTSINIQHPMHNALNFFKILCFINFHGLNYFLVI